MNIVSQKKSQALVPIDRRQSVQERVKRITGSDGFSWLFPKNYTEEDLIRLIDMLSATVEILFEMEGRHPFSQAHIDQLKGYAFWIVGKHTGTARWS